MKTLLVSIFATVALAATICHTQDAKPGPDISPSETNTKPNDRMAWFRDAKFGMFIHWGIYSVPAGKWKGKTSYAEWFQLQTKMPCAGIRQVRRAVQSGQVRRRPMGKDCERRGHEIHGHHVETS